MKGWEIYPKLHLNYHLEENRLELGGKWMGWMDTGGWRWCVGISGKFTETDRIYWNYWNLESKNHWKFSINGNHWNFQNRTEIFKSGNLNWNWNYQNLFRICCKRTQGLELFCARHTHARTPQHSNNHNKCRFSCSHWFTRSSILVQLYAYSMHIYIHTYESGGEKMHPWMKT